MNAGVFQRVLVPVEFEPATRGASTPDRGAEVGDHDWVGVGEWTTRALELAARLARGGEVWLVHATADFMNYATWMPAARVVELNTSASAYSTKVLKAVAAKHCVGVTLRFVIKPGKALDIILETVTEHSPDAIVLAASARGRVSRAFLGSTVDKVIRQSSCPVIVIPSGVA